MTRPTILDLDMAVAPRKSVPLPCDLQDDFCDDPSCEHGCAEMRQERDEFNRKHNGPDTAWDDVRKYVEGLETEVERLKDELGDPDGVVAHANSITKLSEARIAELEAELASLAELYGDEEKPRYTTRRLRMEVERAKAAADIRIAELEKRLADADRVIEPFADRAGKLDGIWKDHETQWSPEYGNTAITIGHLRAARAYMEGK